MFKLDFLKRKKKPQAWNLHEMVVLKANSSKCESCKLETDYCKKLIFADRTICVAPKDKVNLLKKK